MKTLLSLLALALSFSAHAASEACLKPGQPIELYGAVDNFHFFHGGNGMHVTSTVIRLDRTVCVTEDGRSHQKVASFQLMTEENGPGSELKDGDLVKIKGIYSGFGDTIWYSPYPLLNVSAVVKKYETDPAEDAILGR